MATSITYQLPSGQATSITFDATPEQVHDSDADVTEDPVESGAPISDHVKPLPRKVSLSIVVSNTPIAQPPDQMNGVTGSVAPLDLGKGVTANVLQWSGTFDRVKTVHEELERLKDTGTLVTIVTSLRDYPNMVLKSISARRSAEIGDSLEANLQFVQVRIANTTTAPAPATPRATRRGGNGAQAAQAQAAGQPANAGGGSMAANLTGLGIRVR